MAIRTAVKLLTFASESFVPQQQTLNESALAAGVTECIAWTPTLLSATEFYRAHRDILDAKRGSGYWLWKPYLIRHELERAKTGDFVLYYDVGRAWLPHRIAQPLAPLLDWCERQNSGLLPGVYVPEYGPNRKWTKRECFVLMGCDAPTYWDHPQIQATYSLWQKSEQAAALLDEWLKWCTTPGVLSDAMTLPHVRNFPDFVDHRHDQSVLTNLVIKHGIRCHGDPMTSLPGSKDIDNLTDRILGNEMSIRYRSFSRSLQGRIRTRVHAYRARLTRQPRDDGASG
jgi:hypothetical protein